MRTWKDFVREKTLNELDQNAVNAIKKNPSILGQFTNDSKKKAKATKLASKIINTAKTNNMDLATAGKIADIADASGLAD